MQGCSGEFDHWQLDKKHIGQEEIEWEEEPEEKRAETGRIQKSVNDMLSQ